MLPRDKEVAVSCVAGQREGSQLQLADGLAWGRRGGAGTRELAAGASREGWHWGSLGVVLTSRNELSKHPGAWP